MLICLFYLTLMWKLGSSLIHFGFKRLETHTVKVNNLKHHHLPSAKAEVCPTLASTACGVNASSSYTVLMAHRLVTLLDLIRASVVMTVAQAASAGCCHLSYTWMGVAT